MQVSLCYKVLMNRMYRLIAAAELLLVFPAALFMTSLFVRNLQPQQYEPARTARQIVEWFSASPHLGLWLLLIALPLTVLSTGSGALWRRWSHEPDLRHATRQTLSILRTHLSSVLVAAATFTAGSVLAIVALHLLTD